MQMSIGAVEMEEETLRAHRVVRRSGNREAVEARPIRKARDRRIVEVFSRWPGRSLQWRTRTLRTKTEKVVRDSLLMEIIQEKSKADQEARFVRRCY